MSSKFELDLFAIQPSVEQLDICRKDDLFLIADLYQIKVSRGAVKRDLKQVIFKHLVESGVLSERSEAGVADEVHIPMGEGAESPKTLGMAGMDPVDLPSPTDPRLAIRLKELDLELSKQQYQSQLLHARTVEIESQRAIKLKELDFELKNKTPGQPSAAADVLGVSTPVPLPINAFTPSPIPAPRRNLQSPTHVLDHVSSFRERLHSAWKLAHQSLASSQSKMKANYDKKTVKPIDAFARLLSASEVSRAI
ncbi:uncharacterized protein LOC122148207 [Tachysurus ichikawai]